MTGLILLLLIVLFLTERKDENVNVFKPGNNDETTLIEAYNIGYKKAKQWHSNAELVFLTSADSINPNKNGSKGLTGTRLSWNLIFGSPDLQKTMVISIYRQIISRTAISTETVSKDQLIKPEEIAFDSPYILKQAIIEYQLKPGENWAIGYHFTLRKDKSIPFLSVRGLDSINKTYQLFYDAKTGRFLGSVKDK